MREVPVPYDNYTKMKIVIANHIVLKFSREPTISEKL